MENTLVDREQITGTVIQLPTEGDHQCHIDQNNYKLHHQHHVYCNYQNKLSPREMEPLTAICNTFLPSVDCGQQEQYGRRTVFFDQPTINFFLTSASMAGTPQYVGGLITQRVGKRHAIQMRLALLLLSTWIGTLVFCGRRSLSLHYPFARRFSTMDPEARRAAAIAWSISWLPPLRRMFVGFKMLTLLAFFTQLNENGQNPSWEAIGYCGPDPNFTPQPNQSIDIIKKRDHNHHHIIHEEEEDDDDEEEPCFGPLHRGIIDTKRPVEMVVQCLRQRGFQVSYCQQDRLPALSKSNPAPSLTIRCDAVVVGSGSGGGVVAGMLAKAGHKVLVLDKGTYLARTNLSLLEGPSLDQMYEGGGLLTTNDLNVIILAGSTVGGGSQINWSASIRTPDHVITEWSESLGLKLFDSSLYREALDAVCDKMGVQPDIIEEGLNNEVLRRGCSALGYPIQNIPRNAPADHYCGWCFMGCRDGSKKGASETWLRDLVDSNSGAILPGCEATRVLYDKGQGVGIRGKAKGVAFHLPAQLGGPDITKGAKAALGACLVEAEVTIVACGALNTPVLLKRSKLRNANIGKHLHLHPAVMGWGYFPMPAVFPEEKKNPLDPSTWSLNTRKRSYEGGIMTAMSTVVAEFDGSGYGAVLQTPSLHPGMFSAVIPWTSGLDIKLRMSRFSRTVHILALARDKSAGEVCGSSPHNIVYHLNAHDKHSLKTGLEKILRILAAAGAEEIGTHHRSGARLKVKMAGPDEFEEFIQTESQRDQGGHSSTVASAHQMGTCRMGLDPKSSVVDPRGETWEVEGLFLADTSVFPTALGINPMVTTMAIAYCTAQSVLEVLKRKKGLEGRIN